MNANDAIANTIQTADMVCQAYLNDLTAEDLMKRPHAQCNHLNWQVGHLITADQQMINGSVPGTLPPLPEGFAEKYAKEKAASDNPADFASREELMQLMQSQHATILEKLKGMSAEELDQPGPESMRSYAPTVGAAFNMIGTHWLMHCGQWVAIRRECGRDIVI